MDLHDAWNFKAYEFLLSFLQNDSEFPNNFNISALEDDTVIKKQLIAFVEERNQIHQCIKDGNLQQLQTIVSNVKSKFYLNTKNESALYTAIRWKKFQIYAFLKSMGADFKYENEREVLDELTFFEKQVVKEQLTSYFRKSPQAHIHFLISKSRSSKPVPMFDEELKKFYEKLEQIPEISIILQVIQYSDYLDVVFDFGNDNITGLCPHASKNERGQTSYKEGRLYIAAGQKGDNKVLGTLAHELMHMAVEIIFENDCEPYFKYSEEQERNFNKIAEFMNSKFRNLHDDISKVIMESFGYDKADQNSELIARVLQILVQFSKGEEWLYKEANILMDYFKNVVLLESTKFINDSHTLKLRRQIRIINEQLGEIKSVQKSCVSFANVTHIHDFIKDSTENVFLVKGESPYITLLRTLQALYGKEYKNEYSNYVVVGFDVFVREAKNILQTFFPKASEILIIHYSRDSQIRNNLHLQREGIRWISKLLRARPDKKVVFVIDNDLECDMKKIMKLFNLGYICINDKNVTLNDLDDVSQNLILNKHIHFQGKAISITDLFKNQDKVKNLIDAEAIIHLISDQNIEIGSQSNGLAGLDNAYADIHEEINIDILTKMLENPESKIFVFEKANNLWHHSGPTTTNEGKFFEKIEKVFADHSKKGYLRKVKDNYTDEEFKKLCQNNPEKDIYWIQEIQDNKNQERRLLLRKLYTPTFYIQRKFLMHEKIAIKIKEIEKLSKYTGTKCLISNINADEFQNFFEHEVLQHQSKCNNFQDIKAGINDFEPAIYTTTNALHSAAENYWDFYDSTLFQEEKIDETIESTSKMKDKLEIKPDFSRLIFVKNEAEARNTFQELSKSGDTIYWLEKIGYNLLYKQSQGPLTNLKKHIDEASSEKSIVSEYGFTRNIKNKRVFITSDDPGMGKSTTLAKLCHCELSKTYWIIKVHFKDILKNFKEINDIRNLAASLYPKTKNNHLTKLMLQAALDEKLDFCKPLLLVFDGFNEVSNGNDREKIIPLLKFIKEKTKATMFITTRPHLKEILENSLSTFAFEFQPLDSTRKKEFVRRYLETRFNLILETKIFQEDRFYSYSEKFVSEVENAFQADKIRFVGAPLQMHLMLEYVESHFKNWAKNLNNGEPITFNIGKDILEIYSNFIDKKYNFYQTNYSNDYSLEDIISVCEKFHIELAKEITLNSIAEVPLQCFKGIKPNIPLACGIVKCENDRLKFIHPTFQEYYAAKLFISWFKKKDLRKKKLTMLFETIFSHDNFVVVRNFLECEIHDVKVSPINEVKSTKILKEILDEKGNNDLTYLDVAIIEDHVNIFNFVIDLLLLYKINNLLNVKCRFGDSVLTSACRHNKKRIAKSIFEICEHKLNTTEILNFICLQSQFKETCLHHAAIHKNTDMVKLVLDTVKTKSFDTEFYCFLGLKDDYENTPLHLAASFIASLIDSTCFSYSDLQNLHLVIKEFDHINNDRFRVSQTLSESKRKIDFISAVSFIETILEYISENRTEILKILLAKNRNGRNVIHHAIFTGDTNLVKFILNKIEELIVSQEYVNDLLFSCTAEGYNILDLSCINGDVLLITMVLNLIKRNGDTVKQFLHHRTNNGNNALHIAVYYGNFQAAQELLQHAKEESLVFQYEYLISMNDHSITPFGFAVILDHDKIVNLILQNIASQMTHNFLSLPEANNLNALHLAAHFGSSKSVSSILKKLKPTVSTDDFKNYILSKDQLDFNAFHIFAHHGHLNGFSVLLKYAVELSSEFQYKCLTSLNEDKRSPFHMAVTKNQRNVVDLILENIPSKTMYNFVSLSDIHNDNALHNGALYGSSESVLSILKKLKATVSTEEIQNYLLSKGKLGCNAFHISAQKGHFNVFSVLFKYATELSPEFKYKCLRSLNTNKRNPFHVAVVGNQRDIVEFILDNIPSEFLYDFVKSADIQNYNVLHFAAFFGGTESIILILKKLKTTVLANDFQNYLLSEAQIGCNAFHISAQKGNFNVFSVLLKYAMEISPEFKYKCLASLNKNKRNPLHVAVTENQRNVVEFILKNIPSEKLYEFAYLSDIQNDTALHLGASFGSTECVLSILKKLKATISSKDFQNYVLLKGQLGCNAFHISAQKGHFSIFSVLLKYATELSPEFKYKCLTFFNKNRRNPFHIAVTENQRDIVEFILENIPSENLYDFVRLSDIQTYNVLHFAAFFGGTESIILILKKLKATVPTNDFQNYLLSEGQIGCNAFHISAQKGHFHIFLVLIKYAMQLSADFLYECLTSFNNTECTPLHIAVAKNHRNIVEYLINKIPVNMIHEYLCLENRKVLKTLINRFEIPQPIRKALLKRRISAKSDKSNPPKRNRS